ncbi:MAG: DnaJ C-terminal domain-containing protein [Alphaproteobacteria bacterium]
MRDPYEILGVAKTASTDEIRKAYRKLARQNHPDLHPGDKAAENRFKEISAANDLLSDPEKRKRFDAGEIDAQGQEKPRGFYRDHAQGPHARKYEAHMSEEDLAGMGDIFAEMFRRGGARGGARHGFAGFGDGFEDGGFQQGGGSISAIMAVPFTVAAAGGKQRVQLPDGRTIDVTIPEGSEDRQMIRLKGQGMPDPRGGPAGDLYVELHVQPHAFFTRKDNDIHMELPVSLNEAVLGGKVNVPTISGKVALTIPPGSNTGSTLRLKGRGVLDRRSKARGDQYVKLRVVLPDKPDEKLKAFLDGWEAGKTHDPRRQMESQI